MIWLLLDRTVSATLPAALERRGVRCVHAVDEDLVTADAQDLLESAIEDECILVTRNYADFAQLASAYAHMGRSFPGILFLPPGDVPADVLAGRIAAWVAAGGHGSLASRAGWLPDDDAAAAGSPLAADAPGPASSDPASPAVTATRGPTASA